MDDSISLTTKFDDARRIETWQLYLSISILSVIVAIALHRDTIACLVKNSFCCFSYSIAIYVKIH
jgi:hypothetical protein